ncbi:hypothetical protein [Teredinibacter turnerae]|nr:hypothetical protein [Teredinibacter turnerae]
MEREIKKQPEVNVIPMDAKSSAASSERTQQIVPALVGVFYILSC